MPTEVTDDVAVALNAFRAYTEPRDDFGDNPFKLACSFDEPAADAEIAAAWPGVEIPDELARLWSSSRQSRLFEDVEYGQWGLTLLSPEAAAQRMAWERDQRPEAYRPGDVVIGKFIGDQELVVIAPSEASSRRVLIALPLDGRTDWYGAASTLAEFLDRYLKAHGDKYWEQAGR